MAEKKKRISRKELKEKQDRTLERMKETRKADSMFLRIQLENKLKWAQAEIEKGKKVIESNTTTIENCKKRTAETQIIINRLEGAIAVLKDVLKEKKEENNG